ncbi:LysR family transcriptional regulator [Aeromonas veronii]|uniref:LysR family transcriptional regulator n=1 Tax=Aeromonas veronii TaxID=654 RepID=A0A3A9I5V9_AERVE|nr:LysR family transcriptional regulator [Aeromonas veronii]RKJ86395.1 LysR family transcriptional regulator [Aeromonas veronii]
MRRTNHRNLVNVGILSGRIPLISLVQFIAVAEHLNFRHAAKALGISQSSVSARVKALEDNLGVLLFERHARGGHCCKVSDEAAFCLIQRPYISKTLLTRRISPRGSP